MGRVCGQLQCVMLKTFLVMMNKANWAGIILAKEGMQTID